MILEILFFSNKILKSKFLFVLLILILLFLSNCAKEENDIIEFWAMGVEAQHLSELISVFEEENPDIKVKIQAIPWSAAHEKLLTAYAGNSTPDICQMGNTWIPEFVALNALESISEYQKKSKIIRQDNYFRGIWSTNQIDGDLFGIPWYVDTRLLFYRKDIFSNLGYSRPPTSWEEIVKLGKKIVHQGKTEYAFYLPLNGWHEIVAIAFQNNVQLLKDKNKYGNFDAPEFQNAIKFYLKLFNNKLAPKRMTSISNLYQSFANDYFSIYISGPWNLGEFKKRLPDTMQNKWSVAPMPSFDDQYPGLSTAGGSSIVMFKDSKNKENLWKLIEFLSQPKIQAEFYKLSGDLPANKIAWELAELRKNKRTKAFYKQLHKVKPTPKIPEWEQVALKIQQYVEMAVYGTISPSEMGVKLNNEVDKILAKRRWLLDKGKL